MSPWGTPCWVAGFGEGALFPGAGRDIHPVITRKDIRIPAIHRNAKTGISLRVIGSTVSGEDIPESTKTFGYR
jgi:hypothetical protein